MKRLAWTLLALCIPLATVANTTRYVTDDIPLPVRSGKGTQHKIVRMVPGGSPVQVLEDSSDGHSLIRTPQGTEGWVLTRYLMKEPSAREQLGKAQERLETLSTENTRYLAELTNLRAERSALEQTTADLQIRAQSLAEELDDIRRTASQTLEIQAQNQQLQTQMAERDSELQALRQHNAELQEHSRRDWFLAGAGVGLVGLLLGLILPRLSFGRRRRWDQL